MQAYVLFNCIISAKYICVKLIIQQRLFGLQQIGAYVRNNFVRHRAYFIYLLDNLIHQRVIKKKTNKKVYNKHQNTTDMQDYQAVTCM